MNTQAVQRLPYARTPEGDEVEKFILTNRNGMVMEVITFGGIVTSLTAPDRNGNYEDIVLGYTSPEDYFTQSSEYFGALVGRVANRIAKGKFSLNGESYHVGINNGQNSLHGGVQGFDRKIWTAQIDENSDYPTIKLSYVSNDGEEGYPGNLKVNVTYALTNENAFEISYEAETDKATIINLTHHSYFNLSANFSNTILDHELTLDANKMLPIDETLIPTGEIKSVIDTPFDFTLPKAIGQEINTPNEQLEIAKGYDHCWIFSNSKDGFKKVAEVYHQHSGRVMTVATDQPAVQLYSGNFLNGTKPSKTGGMYQQHTGFCLETQHYPDAPNRPEFPTVILNPGEKFTSKTVYQFSARM